MTPYKHALKSAGKFGGHWNDYIELHRFIDSSKYHTVTWHHRIVMHHTLGIEICEKVFGSIITNSEGTPVEVRSLVIQHIQEDLGFVPTLKDWLVHLPDPEPWMYADPKTRVVKGVLDNG